MLIPDDLPPDLAHDITRAAQLYGMSLEDWVTQRLRIACDFQADASPAYREIIDNRP